MGGDGTSQAAVLDDVTVRFEGRPIFEGLSLSVRHDEILVIVGRSGCGKTTVLNLLIGFVKASEGRVTVLGGQPSKVRGDIAYMFARDALLPWRSAVRNVEIGLEIKGVPRAERRRRSLERLATVGMEDKGNLLPRQLSQGMRQRVALARTWVTAPRLLLMDEPFAALDAQTRAAAQDEFVRTWQNDQVATVFVTHDLTEAILVADRIIVMGHGKILDEMVVDFERPRRLDNLVDHESYRDILKRLSEAISLDEAVSS